MYVLLLVGILLCAVAFGFYTERGRRIITQVIKWAVTRIAQCLLPLVMMLEAAGGFAAYAVLIVLKVAAMPSLEAACHATRGYATSSYERSYRRFRRLENWLSPFYEDEEDYLSAFGDD